MTRSPVMSALSLVLFFFAALTAMGRVPGVAVLHAQGDCSPSGWAGSGPGGSAPILQPLDLRDSAARFRSWVSAHPAAGEHPEPEYHFLDEILAEFQGLVDKYPFMIRIFVVGRTVQGRPIWGFVMRAPAHPIRRRMLVVASIHPLEWVPSEVALALARSFSQAPVPGVELTIVPVLNVDGRLLVEQDLLAGLNRYRRGNANGVDLNRDFAVNARARSLWRHLLPRMHASSSRPLSQPESRALDSLADEGRFHLAFSLHAFGGFVYTPWSGRWSRPRDWRCMKLWGETLVAAQGAHAYKVRQLSRWGFFFRAQGTELDHLYGQYGTPTYLVELTRSGMNPLEPSTLFSYFRRYNPVHPARHVREGLRLLMTAVRELPGHTWHNIEQQ